MTRTLYSGKVEPILVSFPETVTEDRWHQPWSERPRPKVGLLAHLQQFQAISFPDTIIESRWHQPWSEPVRVKPRLAFFNDNFFGTYSPIIPAQPYAPWTDPVRRKAFINEQNAFSPFVAPQGFNTFWFTPWTDPTRARPFTFGLPFQSYGYSLAPQTALVTGNFDTVISRVSFQYQSQTGSPQPIIPSIDYFNALSEPVRKKPLINEQNQYTPFTTPAAFNIFWFMPFAELRGSGFMSIDTSAGFIAQENVTEDRWHNPWSEPVRLKRGILSQDLSWPPTPVTVAAFTTFWFSPFSEPVRQKNGLLAALQQFLAQSESAQFPESVTEDRWHQAWSEPVRLKPRAATFAEAAYSPFVSPSGTQTALVNGNFDTVIRWVNFQYQSAAYTVQPQAFNTFWFNPFSDPVRTKPRAADFPYLAQSESAQFPETVTEDRWHNPWSEPVRNKLRDAYFEFLASPYAPIFSVPSFGYFGPFSDPVRRKSQLNTYPFEFRGGLNPIIPSFGYYNWLSEPVRQLARLLAGAQPHNFPSPQPIIPSFGYFNALSVPTLRIPQRQTYPNYFIDPFPFPNAPGNMSMRVTEQGDLMNGLLMLYNPRIRAIVSITTSPPPPPAYTGIIED